MNDLEKTLQFNERFSLVLDDNYENREFYSPPGKEHYKLLSYFSSLYQNATILDIGTHKGVSALALSYNPTNTIHTFDITDKHVHANIKKVSNIHFHLEDLFCKETFLNWKETILTCPFIFLDVDPHNGTMEYEIVMNLKEIGYMGFIVCDDIWYFKEMRNNFWYKMEDKFCYDLTHLGHWSGTGIITFNPTITFPKYTNQNWTLVTAYFNLTDFGDASKEIRERDKSYYLSHASSTLSLPYNLVVYCDKESLPMIQAMRPAILQEKTHYILKDFDSLQFEKKDGVLKETFADYRQKILENRKKVPSADSRNTASYYLFCMSRYLMLKECTEQNPFQSTHFGWINFCIERMGFKNLIQLPQALSVNRDKFSTCYIDYVPESLIKNLPIYFQYGRCGMCSGFFTGNKEYMYQVCDLIENKFLEFLEKGYGHADEQLYSAVYFENPELFKHYYGDYLQMITNYVYTYDAPEAPIQNFIRNSFQHQNYDKCFEGCKFVLNSHLLKKCELSKEWLDQLTNYYMQCKLLTRKTDDDIYL